MNDLSIWNNYNDTVEFLVELHNRSKKRKSEADIPCKPELKVLEDSLIVGILTETNQFIQISQPISEMDIDKRYDLPSLKDNNYLSDSNAKPMTSVDTVITTTMEQDEERKEYVNKIKLETNFFDVLEKKTHDLEEKLVILSTQLKETNYKKIRFEENVKSITEILDLIKTTKQDEKINCPVCNQRLNIKQQEDLIKTNETKLKDYFHELKSVKKEDGILRFIQANSIPFSDRRHLPSIISERIRECNWNPTWKNKLIIKREKNHFQDAQAPQKGPGRYYHIKVFNNHKDKIARNCIAYIWRIKNLKTGETRVLELVELKWKGVTREAVAIAPKSFRFLDAFHVNYSNPTLVNLGLNPFIIDWTGYIQEYQIRGPGDFELDYVVFSEDFSPASAKFRLHVRQQISDVGFEILTF